MTEYKRFSLLAFIGFAVLLHRVQGHGMMLEPVGRSSRWRFDNSAPKNYDDNGLFCGGFNKQWNVNNGKCGLCGDDYSLPTPRPNEIGGKYGQGVIVRSYKSGNLIPVGVKLTANHKGYFYFNLCNLDKSRENEECYQKYNLKLINGQYKFYVQTSGPGWFNTTLQLPKGVSCQHCVLRWTYNAGNNWGICPNGTGAVGCGPQENFRSCADIQIKGNSKIAQKPLFWFSDEDNYLRNTEEDDVDYYPSSYSDEIEKHLSVDDVKQFMPEFDNTKIDTNQNNLPVDELKQFVHDIDRSEIETKEEILNKIRDLLLEILDEEQYLEVENTIENLNIRDE